MKKNFTLIVETLHKPDNGESANVSVDLSKVINFYFFFSSFFLPFFSLFTLLQPGVWCRLKKKNVLVVDQLLLFVQIEKILSGVGYFDKKKKIVRSSS